MSKRAEIAAMKALPDYSPDGKTKVDMTPDRLLYQHGYEQAEKETIERAWEWMTSAKGEHTFEDFRKAMEEY